MMEPMTTILTAIIAGAAVAATQVASQAIKDTYKGLKQLVIHKLGGKAAVEQSIQQVESDPKSRGRQLVLQEELGKAAAADPAAAHDQELLAKAQELLKLLESHGALPAASVQIIQTGSGGLAYGAGAKAAGKRGVVADTITGPVSTGDNSRQIQADRYQEGGVQMGDVSGGIHGSVIAGRNARNVELGRTTPNPQDDPVAQSPALQSLRKILSSLYDTEPSARRVAQESGLDTKKINFSTGAANYWHGVLVEAHKQDKVKALVAAAGFEYPAQAAALREAYTVYEK